MPVNVKSHCANSTGSILKTRRRLQERFDDRGVSSPVRKGKGESSRSTSPKARSTFSLSNVSVPRIYPSRVLRSGANTLSRTINSVQTTFGNLSQKFRRSTKRRYQFKNEVPPSPTTPQTRSRRILGRTPTKLYSPFGIDSPCKRIKDKDKENECGRLSHKKRDLYKSCDAYLKSSCVKSSSNTDESYTEQRKFDSEMEEVRIGIWELRQTANNIVKSSLRH